MGVEGFKKPCTRKEYGVMKLVSVESVLHLSEISGMKTCYLESKQKGEKIALCCEVLATGERTVSGSRASCLTVKPYLDACRCGQTFSSPVNITIQHLMPPQFLLFNNSCILFLPHTSDMCCNVMLCF